MALQESAKGYAVMDSNALVNLTSVGLKTDGGQQPIYTIESGLAGFAPGNGNVTLSLGFFIPIGGPEEEFQEKCAVGALVSVQSGFGPKAYVATGKIMSVDMQQSAGGGSEGTLEWMGPLQPIE